MKPSYCLAILFVILVSLIAVPVSAATATGELGGYSYNQTWHSKTGSGSNNPPSLVYFNDIEYSQDVVSIVRWEYGVSVFDAGVNPEPGEATTFTLYRANGTNRPDYGYPPIVTGTFGYQRYWNNAVPPVEQLGYQYMVFDHNWNLAGLSGDVVGAFVMTPSSVSNITCQSGNDAFPTLEHFFFFGTLLANRFSISGNYSILREENIRSTYSFTKPLGLGIQGNVTKTTGLSKIYIYNSDTNTILSSDSTMNANLVLLNTNAQRINVKMLTPTGNWWNSSDLFTVTTPTPTPTPPPGSYSNLTFTTRYGVNSTVIPNVFVKLYMYHENGPMGDDDWSQAVDGYTDSNGQIMFQQVFLPGWDFRVEFTKPGLYQADFWLEPTQYGWMQTYYMYVQPTSEIPGFPNQVNVTLQLKNAVTFQPVSAAWVTIGDYISGTNYVGQSTNATGYVYFPGIPNTANINGQITKVGYTPLTYWVTSGSLLEGDTALTKYIYLTSVTVTPTITPVIQEGVTLTASPNSVAPGQSTTLTMTCANVTACTGAGGMHVVTYSEKYPDPSWDTHTIAIFHYNTSTTKYDYRPNADVPWQYGTWTGLVATGTPTISGINTYYVNAMRDDYFSIGQANVGVLVTGAVAGNLNMKLASQDQTTGGHLYNYQMNLTNRNTGAITEFNTVVYEVNKLLPRGQDYTVQCSKSGYLPGSQNFQVPTDPNIVDGTMGTFVNCPLYPTGSISAGNTTVTVKVFDAENYLPLPNVQIQMSAPVIYTDSPKYTGGDGAGVFFVLGRNQPYSITASKTGYCAVTETGNTSTLDTKNVYLNLKYGSCIGPTPTHTPTPGPSGTTPGVIVTPTPFNAGNATTFWRPWINVFNMMGANAGEINMLLAGLIILLLMAVGGGVAGVLGAEIFMGFGAIFCVAVGLIPIWVVLAIIILGFLFYGLKIGR